MHILKYIHYIYAYIIKCYLKGPEAEFKEFEPRLKFETWLKYGCVKRPNYWLKISRYSLWYHTML